MLVYQFPETSQNWCHLDNFYFYCFMGGTKGENLKTSEICRKGTKAIQPGPTMIRPFNIHIRKICDPPYFRGNYSFLNLALFTVTFDLYFINLNSCRGNYSREETIQGRKLFAEIRYSFLKFSDVCPAPHWKWPRSYFWIGMDNWNLCQ